MTAGVTNRVNRVPMVMPAAIDHANGEAAAGAAPPTMSNGTMAMTVAAVVIEMGRNRIAAASSIAARRPKALALVQLVGEVHHQVPCWRSARSGRPAGSGCRC